LTKAAKTYDGEKTAVKIGLSACRILKLDKLLPPCTVINSKWTKHLNIRPETLKPVQERARNILEAIGSDFLSRTQVVQQIRERIDKWDYTTKEMVSKLKRLSTEWEKMFASYTSDSELITRVYRELKKLNAHKISDSMKKKMLTIPDHKGKVNQNCIMNPPHSC
jgi:hypothetical protein